MNINTQMIEQMINEYVTQNISNDTDISVTKIKNDIKNIIKQQPGVIINYNRDRLIQEGKTVVKESIKSIVISFIEEGSYTENIQNVKRLEIFI